LGFENNPSFLRKVPASGGDQIADRCPGIYPGSGEIPVRKQDDLCFFVHKININLTPLAVAVCLIQVGCGGDFLFPACYCFLLQIHDSEDLIFCQLTDQAVQGGLWFEIDKSRVSIRLTAPYSDSRKEKLAREAKKENLRKEYKIANE